MRIAILVVLCLFALPLSAVACPLCKEAIASAPEEEPSGADLPAAYNNSIYLMVGMPYLLLGLFSFFVYRGLKLNAQYQQRQGLPSQMPNSAVE